MRIAEFWGSEIVKIRGIGLQKKCSFLLKKSTSKFLIIIYNEQEINL